MSEIFNGETETTPMDEIKNLAQEAEANSGGFMEPGTKSKKRGKYNRTGKYSKKGNPEKVKAEKVDDVKSDPEPQIPTSQILIPAFRVIGNATEKWADHPDANFKDQELQIFADVTGKLIDKYLPNVLEKYALEATAIFMVSQFSIRVIQIKRKRDQEKGAAAMSNPDLAPFGKESQEKPVDVSKAHPLN